MHMKDNGDKWRIVEIDEENYKAVCDYIERRRLDMSPTEFINSILELELRALAYRERKQGVKVSK